MRRREFVAALAAACALPSHAQTTRVPRIGVVHPASVEDSAIYPRLVDGLAKLGYVDGKTVMFVKRSGRGQAQALPRMIAELVAQKVDALIVVGPLAVRTAAAATTAIPIVAIDLESDPVKEGWLKSLANPGGNLTGLFLDLTGTSVKWLQLLREAAPAVRDVTLLWDTASGQEQLVATRAAADQFGVHVATIPIDNWATFERALPAAASPQPRAFVVLSSPVAFQVSARFAEYTARHRIPAISPFRRFAEAGGLMSYGPDLDLFFQRAPPMIDRILRGARPAEIAVEQPLKYDLVINRKTARVLGLDLPAALLLRADEVIA